MKTQQPQLSTCGVENRVSDPPVLGSPQFFLTPGSEFADSEPLNPADFTNSMRTRHGLETSGPRENSVAGHPTQVTEMIITWSLPHRGRSHGGIATAAPDPPLASLRNPLTRELRTWESSAVTVFRGPNDQREWILGVLGSMRSRVGAVGVSQSG